MSSLPRLIVQFATGGSVDRYLADNPLPSVVSGDVVTEAGPVDAEGFLEPPPDGEVVIAYPSPEALAREADEVRHVIAGAGPGVEPLVVIIERAEELHEVELAPLVDGAAHTERAVIMRIMGDA